MAFHVIPWESTAARRDTKPLASVLPLCCNITTAPLCHLDRRERSQTFSWRRISPFGRNDMLSSRGKPACGEPARCRRGLPAAPSATFPLAFLPRCAVIPSSCPGPRGGAVVEGRGSAEGFLPLPRGLRGMCPRPSLTFLGRVGGSDHAHVTLPTLRPRNQ